MSFRKRNVVVSQPGAQPASSSSLSTRQASPGTRPSPLDGRLTTSTGTRSLDSLLAGHAGLVLGSSLLIEESGTTDFGGALLKYYAAEGVTQGHHVHVFGINEGWGRELPGLSSGGGGKEKDEMKSVDERMKIAWRYERLGEIGTGSRDRSVPQPEALGSSAAPIFCHDFDLSKRLILPSPSNMHFVPIQTQPNFDFVDHDTSKSPFIAFLSHLISQISASSSTTIHRIIIPSLLLPAFYPPEASQPQHLLQFLHALRGLLRQYPSQLTALITIPLTLYPRSTGLTRWMELLSDGVFELTPFPSTAIITKAPPGTAAAREDPPQGLFIIHRLPVFHEKGGAGGEAGELGDDLAFTLSRKKGLVIKPYSLPPVDGDSEAQEGGVEHEHGKATKSDLEF